MPDKTQLLDDPVPLSEWGRLFRHEILEVSADAIFITERGGLLRYVNSQACALLGLERASLLTRTLREFMPGGGEYSFADMLEQLARGEKVRREVSLLARNRGEVRVELNATTLPDRTIFVSLRDLSSRLQLERDLLTREERLKDFSESSADWFWETDREHRFSYLSENIYEVLGIPGVQFIGRSRLEMAVMDESNLPEIWDGHFAILASMKPFRNFEYCLPDNQGKRNWLSVSGVPFFAENGTFCGYRGVGQLVTERREKDEELERHRFHLEELVHERTSALEKARLQAEAATSAKSSFLANMSHEIRTPMNAIVGLAQLCLHSSPNEQQKGYLLKIQSASESLLHIINDILDFSKIEAGKLEMETVPFVLETVFDQLASVVALGAEQKRVELLFDIDDQSRVLLGDPLRLGQILTNLVSNALKFSSAGNVVLRAETVRAEASSVELHFSVSDQGIGMTVEQLDRLFQPFVQADQSTTRRFGGTGLGLAICSHLVESMGGRIWVDSQLGEGSTFHFTVCLGTSGLDRRKRVADFGKRLAENALNPVLLVDDNAVARKLLGHLVEQLGLKVFVVESARAALALVDAQPETHFLACLVDWRMPELDGLETMRLLREKFQSQGKTSMPPMLLVTAYSHFQELREVSGRIDGLLAKPLGARHLYAELARCLGLVEENIPGKTARKADFPAWQRFVGADILLVEDIEINQQIIRELLAHVGLSIRIACNGAEALAAVAQKRPDVILMDCQMPVMDGYEATRLLRQNPETKNLPIIALTANAMLADQEQCFAAGMNAHVAKPVRMEVLYEQMVQCLPSARSAKLLKPVIGPSVSLSGLPPVPEMNLNVALANVGGKVLFLKMVLKKFYENQGQHFVRQMREAEAAGDWDGRVRLVHSLKGVASTLGAEVLAEATKNWLSAATKRDEAALAKSMPLIEQHLRTVCGGLADVSEWLELPG